MNYFGITDKGNIRKNNEDTFLAKDYGDRMFFAIVADGMGGHAAGEYASEIAVNSIASTIDSLEKELPAYSERKIKLTLTKMVSEANNTINTKASEDGMLEGMGTTIVLCLIIKNKLYVMNVGDSRLYVVDDKITQITKDHSLVAELLDIGAISPEQAKDHPQKNVITRALGTDATVEPDIFIHKLNPDATVLMCTDGLTNMVSDDDIYDVIKSEKESKAIAEYLVNKAKDNGGKDNITVVVLNNNGGEN